MSNLSIRLLKHTSIPVVCLNDLRLVLNILAQIDVSLTVHHELTVY